jgi:hypothetical protein
LDAWLTAIPPSVPLKKIVLSPPPERLGTRFCRSRQEAIRKASSADGEI